MAKAIDTAHLIATIQERKRILSILEIVEQEDPNDTLSFIKIDPLSLKRLKGLIGEQK